MASDVQICNKALSHLGIDKRIATLLPTERSKEALACKQFFTDVRDEVLRDFPWPFATKFLKLALHTEQPTTEWAYSYTYPTDCMFFRRILGGNRNETRQGRIPNRIVTDGIAKRIYTDCKDAEAEYTVKITDSNLFSPDFVTAMSFLLASELAPMLTSGDPFNLGEKAARFYLFHIKKAQANAANEEQPDELPDAEMILAREGGVAPPGASNGRPSWTDFFN